MEVETLGVAKSAAPVAIEKAPGVYEGWVYRRMLDLEKLVAREALPSHFRG